MARKKAIATGDENMKKTVPKANDHVGNMIFNFGRFIRYNTRLQTIRLNSAGLNSQFIAGLVPWLRHAKSLLCLHMASNPGISGKVKDFYCDRLAVKIDNKMHMDIPAENLGPLTNEETQKLSTFDIKLRAYKKKHQKMWKAEEVEKYLINKTIKPLL